MLCVDKAVQKLSFLLKVVKSDKKLSSRSSFTQFKSKFSMCRAFHKFAQA